jgi:hypothetical protein
MRDVCSISDHLSTARIASVPLRLLPDRVWHEATPGNALPEIEAESFTLKRPSSQRWRSKMNAKQFSRRAGAITLALLVVLGILAGPAHADYSISFSPKGGTVGKAIPLSSKVSSGALGVGSGVMTYFVGTLEVARARVDTTGTVSVTSWIPSNAGNVQMTARYTADDGSQTAVSKASTVTINKAESSALISMPSTARIASDVTVTAQVTVEGYAPTGTVTFIKANGTPLTTAALDAGGQASITVQMPSSPTTYQLRARYDGDENAKRSTSAQGRTVVTNTGSRVSLSVPNAAIALGASVPLTASVSPPGSTGVVTFSIGSIVLGSSAVASGRAVFQWSPATIGPVTLTASFIPTGAATSVGQDSIPVTVLNQVPTDQVSLTPSGSASLGENAGYPLRNGTSVTFTATSTSGNPVTLSVTGPCSVNGLVVRANSGNGSCALTATTRTTAQFQGANQSYTITLILGKPSARLTAPASGRLSLSRSYSLSPAGTKATSGSQISWRVTKGVKRCTVGQRSNGSWVLKTIRPGRCLVRAVAPRVPGEWRQASFRYRYQIAR